MKFKRETINKSWLLGVAEFNSFFVVEKKATTCLTDFLENLVFLYIVKMDKKNIATLYRFKTIMGVGKIVENNINCYYYVERENYLYEKIVKFFSGNKLVSFKRIEYERFRYVLHKKYCAEISCSNVEYINNYIDKYCVCYKNLTSFLKSLISIKKNNAIAKFNFYLSVKLTVLFLYFLKDKVR